MSRPSTVRARAPAKINLRLEVLGRREDGFHEIRTWMLALDLCDHLEARASSNGIVTLALEGDQASPDIPTGRENLAFRAATAVLAEGRRRGLILETAGVDLVLAKHIPSRAGLGGGSSDAAAAWIATGAALGLGLEPAAGESALASLGADCAFFASARETGFARCEGRGERVTAAAGPRRSWWVAVVAPGVACSTAAAYAALDSRSAAGGREPDPHSDWLDGPASAARPFLFNRLEEAALDAFPSLRPWRRLLDESGSAHWRLSGSGSSFFGLYDRREEAEEGLGEILAAAGRSALLVRGGWVSAPAGRGANIVEVR